MSLPTSFLRTTHRSSLSSHTLAASRRTLTRHYIFQSKVVSGIPSRSKHNFYPPTTTVQKGADTWRVSTQRRIAKCLTYGVTPEEQVFAAGVLKKLNGPDWWAYVARYPASDTAIGFREFRPEEYADGFDLKSPVESRLWLDYVIEKSIQAWLTKVKSHVWQSSSPPNGPEPDDSWLDNLEIVHKKSWYQALPDLKDKFTILHKVKSSYPYQFIVGSTLVSEKYRHEIGSATNQFNWRESPEDDSSTGLFAETPFGKLPDYVVEMLDKYYSSETAWVDRTKIQVLVKRLEKCYQRPEDMGSAAKPAAAAAPSQQ